ncbi:MAG: hypothetical protein R3F11_01635 [Verrucomicrobiales bacterium]
MKPNRFITSIAALILAAASATAESPKVGCAAEVGNPAGGGRHWVLVFLKYLGNAEPGPGYRLYWKAGAPDSANSYALLSTIQPTADPVTIAHLLGRASDAGIDVAALEARIDEILAGAMGGESLAVKLTYLIQAAESDKTTAFQIETLANTNAAVAAARGRAYFAAVPAGISTFEVRAYDPGADAEGATLGRATVGAAAEVLPAPAALTEWVNPNPTGHLRVQLQWCYPDPLRQRFLHWRGAAIFRASRDLWASEFGAPPPLNISRAALLAAVDSGHIVRVNGLPVLPDAIPPCPFNIGVTGPMFTDDNDSAAQTQLDGAPPFVAGVGYVYYVAETDLFGRVGEPSAGLSVTICDRIAPPPPLDLAVTNERRFAAGSAEDFLRLEWPAASPSEVRRWYLYCAADTETPMLEYQADKHNPATPSLLATIPNDGSFEVDGRIRFDHDSAAALPMPGLGKTVFYRLRAEDDTPCKDAMDRGNISGLSGPVPAARHDLMGPDSVGGRIVKKCCHILVAHQPGNGDPARPFTARLLGVRPPGSRFHWVEFRDDTNGRDIGRYYFAPGQDAVAAEYQPGNGSATVFSARFGHPGGYLSAWQSSGAADRIPYGSHTFTPRWLCEDDTGDRGCPGLHFPKDPETGEVNDICLFLTPVADVKSWVAYVQFGVAGQKTKFASGNIADGVGVVEVCFNAFPPRGGELCFYVQGFDAGGNPGPMEPLGCVKVAAADGLPVPSITGGSPATDADPGASPHDFVLDWVCPPGAERFDVAFTPPPAKAEQTFLEIDSSGALREWGTIQTDRVPTAFGQNAPEFANRFTLINGVSYKAKVRAVSGFGGERDEGAWSQPFALHWLNPTGPFPQVPWPMHDVPGVASGATLAWDAADGQLLVLIGGLPFDSPTITLPADSLDPYLYYDLPLVAYLRETTADGTAKWLQVTHRFDEILANQTGGINITDSAIKILPGDGTPIGELWLRIDQAVLAGRTYEVALVLHDERGEIREVIRTNEAAIPALP